MKTFHTVLVSATTFITIFLFLLQFSESKDINNHQNNRFYQNNSESNSNSDSDSSSNNSESDPKLDNSESNDVNNNQNNRYYQTNSRNESMSPIMDAGTRGNCYGEYSSFNLKIFAPMDHLGLTTKNYPTFFLYLHSKKPQTLKFILIEVGEKEPIYEKTILTNPDSSLMQITLPSTVEPLKVNKKYKWTLMIICNLRQPSLNYMKSTILKVVELEKTPLFQNMPLDKKAILLANSGIWYDSLYYAKLSGNYDLFESLLQDINIYISTYHSQSE